jgi:ubiquitin-conjugating enzyme E2 S
VETLKRDWSSTLKLRDVLVTISCLLIQPNPASALNEAAGKLASEDWDGFCRRAKLMTGIHAAVPKDIAQEVKEAQMRGEDPEQKDIKSDSVDGAGKEKGKAITPVVAKVQQSLTVPTDDDEENRRRRGDTAEPVSDPESDWIPGPVKLPKAFPSGRDNILGIKGLDDSMQLDSSPKKARIEEDRESVDDSDPFVVVPTKHKPAASTSFSLRVPSGSAAKPTPAIPSNTATPDALKFSSANPFSAIRPNNQTQPLLKEFSWSWQDSEILHGTDTNFQEEDDVPTRPELRKRMSGDDFEAKRKWEMKRFKKTGYDLSKYNRGDFGPRTGIGRL